MGEDIIFISKSYTTLELVMNKYHITLNFLPEKNEKLLDQAKDILISSLADNAQDIS